MPHVILFLSPFVCLSVCLSIFFSEYININLIHNNTNVLFVLTENLLSSLLPHTVEDYVSGERILDQILEWDGFILGSGSCQGGRERGSSGSEKDGIERVGDSSSSGSGSGSGNDSNNSNSGSGSVSGASASDSGSVSGSNSVSRVAVADQIASSQLLSCQRLCECLKLKLESLKSVKSNP